MNSQQTAKFLFLSLTLAMGNSACVSPETKGTTPATVTSTVTAAVVTTNQGTWDLRDPFPGAGIYAGVSNSPAANELCATLQYNGVAGNSICEAAAGGTVSTAANVRAGTYFWDATGTSVVGTMPDGANTAGANGSISKLIPAAYYDGTHTVTLADANLVSTNILSGVSLFGVVGDSNIVNTSAATAIASEVLFGKKAYVAGALVTGTMPNQGAWDSSLGAFPGVGYYSSITNNPTAAQVCSVATGGQLVIGVTPSALCATGTLALAAGAGHISLGKECWGTSGTTITGTINSTDISGIASNIPHEPGSQITIANEGAALPAGFRLTPDVTKDDDGASGNVTPSTRPAKVCGMGISAVTARISNCTTQNAAAATWDGATLGHSGESSWSLVTAYKVGGTNGDACGGGCTEVWRDNRTNLLWSDEIGNTNWCKASGNVEVTGTDCTPGMGSQAASPESWCAEKGGLTTPVSAADTAAKGEMRATSTASTPSIYWRLPTIADWHQANIDGIRFVLRHMVSGGGSTWSSTTEYNSANYTSAYSFDGVAGTALARNKALNTPAVRCVGR